MTAVNSHSILSSDPLVRVYHLTCVMGISVASFDNAFKNGRIPKPDARGVGNGKAWRLSTIRALNPAIADAVEVLLTHPAFPAAVIAHAA